MRITSSFIIILVLAALIPYQSNAVSRAGGPSPRKTQASPAAAAQKTPHPVWSKTLAGYYSVTLGPANEERMAVFATLAGSEDKTRILVLNRAGGQKLWEENVKRVNSSASDHERLYLLTGSDSDGEFVVLDWKTGKQLWSVPARPGGVMARDGIVVCSAYGVTTAYDGVTHLQLWKSNAGDVCALGYGKACLFSQEFYAGKKVFTILDARTGKTLHEGVYNDTESSIYELGKVAWIEPSLLMVQEGYFGPGTRRMALSTVWERQSPAPIPGINSGVHYLKSFWTREQEWGFEFLKGVVIAEEWNTGEQSVGFTGLNPKTKKVHWSQPIGGILKGIWEGTAVAIRTPEAKPARLVGLRPTDGKEAWSLPILNAGTVVTIYDRQIAVLQGDPPRLQVYQ